MTQDKQIVSSKGQSGSSLVGVAILTLALGFLITGGIYLLQNYNTIQSDQTTVDYTRTIQDAIANYVALEGRYPCPAPLDAQLDTVGDSFGKEASVNCNAVAAGTFRVAGTNSELVRIGAVPVRTLGLPDRMIADGYGKRYIYAITESMTKNSTKPQTDLGAITIENTNGVSISSTPGRVTYALMSPGEDDRGAYNIDGQLLANCDETAIAGNNCGFTNATFIVADKIFTDNSNSFTHSFAFEANETPYRWHVTPYSDCSAGCFVGTQTRAVTCRDDRNQIANEVNCNHTPRPEISRVCAQPTCHWFVRRSTRTVCSGGTGGHTN